MNGACGVNGSRERHFTNEEETALKKDESTSQIVNTARRNAGGKEADVAVRGDDKTLDYVLHHPHVSKGEALASALHGLEVIEAVGVAKGAFHATGRAGIIAPPVIAFFAAQYGMYEMEKRKAELKDGATRDQLHAAIVMNLDVPGGFKNEQIGKLGVETNPQSPCRKIADQLAIDTSLHATLQMHCDKGIHAAKSFVDSGQTKEAFLATHPDIKERYDADAAYRNGFDSLVWSHDRKDGGATYREQLAKLEGRDGWYSAACITIKP